MMHLKVTFIALIFFLASPALTQEADFILSKFFATQVEDEVLIRWTITAGNTCQDTYVERSEDGAQYKRIGLIGGICGSPDASITYDYYDTMPLSNRINHYRLQLGQYGFTSSKTVEFKKFNDQGFLVAPNPFTDFTRIAFQNDDNEEHSLIITDFTGRVIMEKKTNGEEFIISGNQLSAGNYIFQVFSLGNLAFKGKLHIISPQ